MCLSLLKIDKCVSFHFQRFINQNMTFSKVHDKKHYLDNQSEDSSKGYLRKGCHQQYYLAKVDENMHIQNPGENLILWKTAQTNLVKLFRVCSGDIYHAKKHKNSFLGIYFGLSLLFTQIYWTNIALLIFTYSERKVQ